MTRRLGTEAVRYQGNWFPHELRPAAQDGVFFVGDSAGHCIPLSGEGIRTAFYFGIACGRELRAVLTGAQRREQALAAYGDFSAAHAPAFRLALRLQRLVPALPPRVLTAALAVIGRERPCRRAFDWYLEQAHPRFAGAGELRPGRALTFAGPTGRLESPARWRSPSTSAGSLPASSRTGPRARS
jgi:2-polyprenyl-6-methoxyphenol hydroxylase-like FAD-dependent oxidoreductase